VDLRLAFTWCMEEQVSGFGTCRGLVLQLLNVAWFASLQVKKKHECFVARWPPK
jgi:hypothetical protein